MKHSDKELSLAAERAFIECYAMARASSPTGVVTRDPDRIIFEEGVKSRWVNGVLYAGFTSESMPDKVGEVVAYFKKKDLPITWYVGPSSTPPELEEHLETRGFTTDWALRGMALELENVLPREPPPGLSIRAIENPRSLETCVDIAARSYGFDDISSPLFKKTYLNFGCSPSKRWFQGTMNGVPVATSLLVLHGALAVTWLVATLPEERGRGIGTAMTLETLLLAKELGYDYVVLQASESGLPVYERMGFKEYCKVKEYFMNP
jgi:hypothetical protein